MRSAKVLLGAAVGLATIYGAARAQDASTDRSGKDIREYEEVAQHSPGQNSGAAWWKLAMLYQDQASFADAERAYAKALELLKTGEPVALANMMDCMGTMYVQEGRFAEGEEMERKALAIRQQQKDALGIGLSWMHLAMLSMGKQDHANGEMYAELAVGRLVPEKGDRGATGEQKMTALTYLALARCAAHECKDAMQPLKRAMSIAEASYSETSFPVSYIRFLEGYVNWKRGNDRAAAKLMRIGTEGMEEQLGWNHPTFVSAMRQYEGFLVATQRTAEASEVREKLVRLTGLQTAASTATTTALR